MPAKIFISCGQASPEERKVAQGLGAWFNANGYASYVAIEVQSILDLNVGIVAELKTSDYYLFINFKRELVTSADGSTFRRGSVYSNQELAIAYALGFDQVLLVNQKGASAEGVFKFMVTNVPEFVTCAEVLPIVQGAVAKAGWHPDYTRQLTAENLRLDPPVQYRDHTGVRIVRTLLVDVKNERPDLGAVACVARLARYCRDGQPVLVSPDNAPLKVTGSQGYAQTIWPNSHGTFDLLAVDAHAAGTAHLHTSQDIYPRRALISVPGHYRLEYEVFSQGFPPLGINVLLILTGDLGSATATLI